MQISIFKDKVSSYLLKINPKVAEIIYFGGLIIYLLSNYLRGTMFINRFGINIRTLFILNMISIMIVLFKIILFDNCFNIRYLVAFLLAVIFFAIGKQSQDFDMFYCIFFVVGAKNIDFKKILRIFLMTNITLLVITFCFTWGGMIKNVIITRTDTSTVRYALGTIYPTDLAARIFYMIMAYCALNISEIRVGEYVSIFSVIVLTYVITDTRLDMILMLIFMGYVLFRDRVDEYIEKIKAVYIYTMGVFIILTTILCSYFYSPGVYIFKMIDSILSGRLYFGHVAFKNYNLELLGQFIYQNGFGGGFKPAKYFYIDSSFLRILFMQGIFAFIVFLCLIIKMFYNFITDKLYFMIVIWMFVIISSAIDQHFLELSYNIFLLALLSDFQYFNKDSKLQN